MQEKFQVGIDFASKFKGAKFLYPRHTTGLWNLYFKCHEEHEFSISYMDVKTGRRKDFCRICPDKELESKQKQVKVVQEYPLFILQKKIGRNPFKNVENITITPDKNPVLEKQNLIKRMMSDIITLEKYTPKKSDKFRMEQEALKKGTTIHGRNGRIEYRIQTFEPTGN